MAEREIDALMRRQHGLISRAQATTRGLTKNMIHWRLATGQWTKIHPSVFRLSGAPETQAQSLLAACLWAGPEAVVSHRSAGVLYRLDGVSSDHVELTVSCTKKLETPGVEVHRSRDYDPRDVKVVDRLPVTSIVRTLIDLAPLLSPNDLELALEHATRKWRRLIPWLSDRIKDLPRRPGYSVLRKMVALRLRKPSKDESPLETRMRQFLARHGLPATQQVELHRNRRIVARFDFCYPDLKLALDTDGRCHIGLDSFEKDRRRDGQVTLSGWTSLRLTWSRLTRDGAALAQEIREARANAERQQRALRLLEESERSRG